MITLRLFIGTFLYSATDSISDDCRLPGVLYQGTKNVTETGRPCQRWDTQIPHEHAYDTFRLAKENYCRNFDREEPWCFTNDTDVRWELCGVEVCETPCLNQSFYTTEIKNLCVHNIPSDSEYCSNILNLVSCLKKNIENLIASNCSQITWRSIALQMKDTLEDLTGKSISQCILPHCLDPILIDNSFNLNLAIPCYNESTFTTTGLGLDVPKLCRMLQRYEHCVVSNMQDRDKTNSTCPVKDKLLMSRRLISLTHLTGNVSFCVKYFYSEFPVSLENITDTTLSTGSEETNTDFSQTAIFLAVGFAVALIIAVSFAISIYKIRAITMRKRRKELMRLPSIPKSQDPPYEMQVTNPENPYFDPDYEIIEEQDEGYEHLPEPGETTLTLTDGDGPYIDPDNVDGKYLDVVHSEKEPNDYINVSPYIELVDDTIDDVLKSEAVDSLQSENAAAINLTVKIDVEKNKEVNEDFPP